MDQERGYCLFVPHSFLPVEGGAQQYLYDIASSLTADKLVVFAPPAEDRELCRRFDRAQPMEIVRLSTGGSRGGMIRSLIRTRRLFKTRNASRLFGNFFRLARFIVLVLSQRSLAAGVDSVLRGVCSRLPGEKLDVVHNGYILPSGLAAYALHCFFGIPYVIYTYAKELFVWEEDPVSRRVGPGDFLATIYHHLGIEYNSLAFSDFAGR